MKKKLRKLHTLEAPKKYGYIADIIQPDHYIFGAGQIDGQILQPNGQWDAFLPIDELQSRDSFESCNCTGFSTNHAIATLAKRLFGADVNKSDRFTGIIAGTLPPGNSPHTVAEAIRKQGMVEEASLPFSSDIDSVAKFYSPIPLTPELKNEGFNWLAQFDFGHEWVFANQPSLATRQALMMSALKYSPLGAAVYAWYLGPSGFYESPQGTSPCHWVCVYGYEEEKYWKIFDTYDKTHKQLAWDFDFQQVKRYSLQKKSSESAKNENWFIKLIKIILAFFGIK